MKLSLLTNGWGMMFGVPTAVVDKYLKLSTPSQLKVLLYLLRHQCTEIDTAQISKALSMNEELIEEALIFWEQTELFLQSTSPLLTLMLQKKKHHFIKLLTLMKQQQI